MNTNRMAINLRSLHRALFGLATLTVLLAVAVSANAQAPVRVVKPNYAQAERYSSQYLRQFVYDSSVRPNWIGKTDKFWYSYRTSAGTKYYRVDPAHATKEDLFDHVKLASLLSQMLRKPLDSTRLPLTRVEMEDDGSAFKFVVEKLQYQFNLDDETLVKLGKAPPAPVSSRFGSRGRRDTEQKKDDEKKDDEKKDEKQKDEDKKELKKTDGEKKDIGKGQDKKKKTGNTNSKKKNTAEKKRNNQSQTSEKSTDEKTQENKNDKSDKTNVKTDSSKKQNSSKRKKQTTEKVTDAEKDNGEQKQGEKEKNKSDDKSTTAEDKAKETKKPQTDHRAFSPDRTAYVYTKGYDLYLVELPKDYKYVAPKSKESSDTKDSKDDSKDADKQESTKKNDESKSGTDDTIKSKENDAKDQSKQEAETESGKSQATGKKKKQGRKKRQNKKKKSETTESDDVATTSQSKDEQTKGIKKQDGKQDGKKKTDDGKKDDDTNKSKKAKSKDDEDDEKEKELPIPDIGPELDETAVRLSEDGEEKFGFARRSRSSRGSTKTKTKEEIEKAKTLKSKPSVTWSKDSKAFYISRRDSRKVKELFVINSLSTPRPTLEKYSYSMPGEDDVSISHSYYVTRADKKLVELKPKWKNETIRGAHWKKEGHQLRFVRSDRLLRNVEFCELDLSSGEITCLLQDGFDAANIAVQDMRYLKDTDEMIWFSERSGWAHFYLYDLDGNLKNAITSGEYRASRIVDIDEKNRLVYFTGNGRENGENIYNTHLYCVRLDGTGLTLLDPGNAYHRSTLSKSKKFLVDNCSRVDMAPISVLRDAQGNVIMKLEESDMSRLTEVGWKIPETFVVKAADGVTDLYGNIWKPFDFDPAKKYPIIAHVYPGPQTEGTSHTFSATAGNQQLAQLGFIVIQVGHRGGTPQRSKAYHSYGYFNLRDYGLADKKAAIEQLGQRFPWVDVQRVGIYGHSGGGFMTAAALLREPYNEFFKVGVSTAGNHDNNIYNSSWSERYHGLKEVPVVEAKNTSANSDKKSTDRTVSSRTVRTGAPESAGAYSAFSAEESDFFYENEGILNEDGDLEFSSDSDLYDGPRVFQQQDTDGKSKKKSDQKDAVVTQKGVKKGKKKKSDEKADSKKVDDSKSEKSTEENQEGESDSKEDTKKKTRFEIKVPTNAELAGNLRGHLFLVHGEADNNVHPANTLRLVDALIKADKRFDMLYLPGTRHGFGSYQPYVTQRMYEYFAEHLLNDYQSDADMKERQLDNE